ncbi:MAG: thiamine-monophosphate kinase [Phycisphaerae bacterium]|nr:thiamine-monophosphate kinase [Phycisphaerae bacterium]
MSTPGQPERGERALIRRLAETLANLASAGVPFGDDMAQMSPGDNGLLGTTDMLMDGVDFDSRKHAWFDIGRKSMAVNLSDCAAMAVRPLSALGAVALNNRLSMDDALELHRGIRACGDEFDCPLVGGDTNSWDAPTAIAITVIACPEPGLRPVRRDGAKPGDLIYLTGPVGGSILGRHLRPVPRIKTALAVSRELSPRAMIDISDGVAVDLGHIIEASSCAAEIDEASLALAIHADAQTLADQDGTPARDHALHDGEDFELVIVLPPDADQAVCQRLGLLPLGRILSGSGLMRVTHEGRRTPIEPRGWEHFR